MAVVSSATLAAVIAAAAASTSASVGFDGHSHARFRAARAAAASAAAKSSAAALSAAACAAAFAAEAACASILSRSAPSPLITAPIALIHASSRGCTVADPFRTVDIAALAPSATAAAAAAPYVVALALASDAAAAALCPYAAALFAPSCASVPISALSTALSTRTRSVAASRDRCRERASRYRVREWRALTSPHSLATRASNSSTYSAPSSSFAFVASALPSQPPRDASRRTSFSLSPRPRAISRTIWAKLEASIDCVAFWWARDGVVSLSGA